VVDDPVPQPPRAAVGLKTLLEQRPADLGHPAFDAGGDRRRRLVGVLEVILEVPAQLFLLVRGERERELGRRPPGSPRSGSGPV
jgi:hypothetical protein